MTNTLSKHQINQAAIRQLVEAMNAAPSGDNCQPFRYEWADNVLKIYLDQTRAKHFFNIDNTASLLALGCQIEAACIQATSLSLSTSLKLKDTSISEQEPIAEIEFIPADLQIDPLAGVIKKRYTDRRVYTSGVFTDQQILEQTVSRFEKSRMHLYLRKDKKLTASICAADQILWTVKKAHQDLVKWLRLTKASLERKDGMPWRTLGIGQFERVMLLASRTWIVQKMLNLAGGLLVSRAVLKKQLASSSGLIAVTIENNQIGSIVEAGRQSFRIWLQLNALGYGVQPISIPTFFSFAKSQNKVPQELTDKHLSIITRVEDNMRRAFELTAKEMPIWMFRFGTVPDMPANLKAPRLDVMDLLVTRPR